MKKCVHRILRATPLINFFLSKTLISVKTAVQVNLFKIIAVFLLAPCCLISQRAFTNATLTAILAQKNFLSSVVLPVLCVLNLVLKIFIMSIM